jgi:formylglycine-generating enzyme
MTVAWIPPGTFLMGSPKDEPGRSDAETQHRVKLSKGFYMGIHPVSRVQFLAFVEQTGYRTQAEKDGGIWPDAAKFYPGRNIVSTLKRKVDGINWRRDIHTRTHHTRTHNHPVGWVSWDDSLAFANWLSQMVKIPCRLPTEAEWEYACRAGTTTPFSTGETISTEQANYTYSDGGAVCSPQPLRHYPYKGGPLSWTQITPAGQFLPNAWGLHDMHGNVSEWCQDWFGDYPQESVSLTDPKGSRTGTERVIRGGWFYCYPEFCRSASRLANPPHVLHEALGFRVRLCPNTDAERAAFLRART